LIETTPDGEPPTALGGVVFRSPDHVRGPNEVDVVSGAVPVAEDEQKGGVRVAGAAIRVGHVVRDVRRAPAVRQAGGRRFPRVRRIQAGRGGLVAGRPPAVVVRGLRAAPVARQTARVGRHGRGTGPWRWRRVHPVGRDARGFAARGRGRRQETPARRRGRSVYVIVITRTSST